MRIVGVIDLMGGVVVRAVAGRREAYRPIVTPLCSGSAPLAVARSLVALGVRELYAADLDAIAGAEPAWGGIESLGGLGVPLWVDAGVCEVSRAVRLGVDRVVVGLESVPDPAALGPLVDALGDRIVFSLDLREGVPMGAWHAAEPFDMASEAIGRGVRRVLVLDLARVGVSGGTGTEALCSRIIRAYPGVEVSAGGGVRDRGDVERLRGIGVSAVLVASALHDGRLARDDIAELR